MQQSVQDRVCWQRASAMRNALKGTCAAAPHRLLPACTWRGLMPAAAMAFSAVSNMILCDSRTQAL